MSDVAGQLLAIIPFAFLAIVGASAYAIFVWRNTDRRDDDDPGIGTPRRVYFYSVSFVALMMAASGASVILSTALDSLFRDGGAGDFADTLALGLALVAVGVPVWLFHWRFVRRAAARTAAERRSVFRSLYLYTTLGAAFTMLGVSAFGAAEFALFAGRFDGFAWAAIPVWGAVWAHHWRVASAESGASAETLAIRRMYLYLASAVALAALAIGAWNLAGAALLDIYRAAFGAPSPADGLAILGDETRSALAAALVGAVGWIAHWFIFARGDRRSVLRWAHLLIAALGGGFAVALIGFAAALYAALQWAAGAADSSLADHFAELPKPLAAVAVGACLWQYHRKRGWAEASETAHFVQSAEPVSAAARIYALALTAIGLVAVGMALAALAETSLVALAERAGADMAYYYGPDLRDRLAYILTLLAVGCPVWWTSWRLARSLASDNPHVERTAAARKVYTLGVLCLGLLALLGGGSAALYTLLSDLLDANLSAETLLDLALPMSAVLPPAVILPYHWIVYRQDRAFEPDEEEYAGAESGKPPIVRKDVTLLAESPALADETAAALESALGYPVRRLHDADSQLFGDGGALDDSAPEEAARAIAESGKGRALVIKESDGRLRVVWDE